MPLDPPVSVEAGEVIVFKLQRPEFGVWSWAVTSQGSTQKHSTFLSEPLSAEKLQKKSDNYQASLSDKGKLALHVMQRLNGNESTLSIANDIAINNPHLFPSVGHAKRFVVSLVEHHC